MWDKARELLGQRATLPLARAISDSARWVSVLPNALVTAGRGEATPRMAYGTCAGERHLGAENATLGR